MLVACVVSFLERELVTGFLLLAVVASVAVPQIAGTRDFEQVCGLLMVILKLLLLQY